MKTIRRVGAVCLVVCLLAVGFLCGIEYETHQAAEQPKPAVAAAAPELPPAPAAVPPAFVELSVPEPAANPQPVVLPQFPEVKAAPSLPPLILPPLPEVKTVQLPALNVPPVDSNPLPLPSIPEVTLPPSFGAVIPAAVTAEPMTLDQILERLRKLREEKTSLDQAEQDLKELLRSRVQNQAERLAKLGVLDRQTEPKPASPAKAAPQSKETVEELMGRLTLMQAMKTKLAENEKATISEIRQRLSEQRERLKTLEIAEEAEEEPKPSSTSTKTLPPSE